MGKVMKQLVPITLLASLLIACSAKEGESEQTAMRTEALNDIFVRLNVAATSGDRTDKRNRQKVSLFNIQPTKGVTVQYSIFNIQ